MEFYILKSGICLGIFYGFYKLVLEKESFHVFKRFYLLASVALAFVIPLITFTEYIEVVPQEVPLFFPESSITNTVIEAEPINYIPIILWSIYGFGVLLFSFKFLKNLSGIIFRIKRNPKFKNQSFIHVLLQDLVIPHTFLSYIFLNKHKFETHQIPKEVLLHEETHAKQKHSLDVLFIEILQILIWFNPIIYFFKHSIKLNHEFLADHAVLKLGIASSTYQNILLAFSSNVTEPPLANAINYSSIKKRFTVMKTHTSKQAFWLRSFILLPLLAILIYSFSEKKVIEKPFVVQQNITVNGVTEIMMKEYRDFINDFEISNRIIYPKYLRAVAIYDLMTKEQRNSVKKYPEDIVSNLSNIKPKNPTETEFNSWKDSNKFAIWIDGKHVKNSELNNYKASHIKYFANSFVHKNARNERFPQPYQNHIYTQKGFDTTFTNSKKDDSALNQIKKELEQDKASNEIKIHISKDKKVKIDNKKIDINSLSDKLIELTKNEEIKPQVNIDIEGYLNTAFLKDITSEVKKSKLIISKIRASSIYLDETDGQYKRVSDYFKGVFTADTIVLKNKKGELIKGTTGPQIVEDTLNVSNSNEDYDLITIKLPKNRGRNLNSNDLEKLNKFVKGTFYNRDSHVKIDTEVIQDSVPPPPPPVPKEIDDHSKESLKAREKIFEKANTYGEAMQVYFKEKKGNLNDLKKQYKEVMELYNSYEKLLKKENLLPPPPPPPAKN